MITITCSICKARNKLTDLVKKSGEGGMHCSCGRALVDRCREWN